ncbi:hypothetical protein BU15DRAFT_78641 [Melanogaster broomeanus]|nr:hypothetical protein BU15DRAFT_78641 [Melanogaster broomeanus]
MGLDTRLTAVIPGMKTFGKNVTPSSEGEACRSRSGCPQGLADKLQTENHSCKTVILNTLVKALEDEKDEELLSALHEVLCALLEPIGEPLNTMILLLLGWTESDAPRRRASAFHRLLHVLRGLELDPSLYRVAWVRQPISLFDDPQVPVHTNAWQVFDIFLKSMPNDELERL